MELYQIGKLIGTGSSGDVFLCKHKTDKSYNYALKKIKIIQIDEKERQNIQNELKILQKLRHINIVSYKDSFTDQKGNLCIVMIYCELGDMHTKIKQMKEKGKNFTESQILDWLTQIALAIYYLHSQKILHRDLKTQNLFLKKDERIKEDLIKLGDFGIAKVLDTSQDLARTCIGTPYYMAPEVFRYHPYSYKSDIWSLGIILYEMCNLRLPFQAQHYNALAMKILQGSYPSIMPTYSKQLRDLISSMLSKKIQDRPSIIDVLNKPFIKTRNQKYINDLLSRNSVQTDMDDIYLDTLREQAIELGIVSTEQEGVKKYPSLKDLDKKQGSSSKSFLTRRTEEEDNDLINQYHSKRKSTFDKESYPNDRAGKKAEETSSSFKALYLGCSINQEKEAFVDHKRNFMMEKLESKRKAEEYTQESKRKAEEYSQENIRRFTIYEPYSMEEESAFTQIDPISEEIKEEESDQEREEEEEVPETYNKSYYKLLHKIKVLKHRCETTLGGNKYLRVYNAVNNGANKTSILEILEPQQIGYWHLIDQIMFNESILKTLPKN